ncbi:MAG TPA: hypothetical protein VGO88_00765 [Mycetocola sp.]|jgi:hypothetical protein|uniref:hypothetical protein n=1 Tax=Mycetocola sp. TaxID=1871042 RepID=UPI00260581A8|nr:hypothetical protein [Mycetocola sp.]MCU1419465.1 hypothetical protein [Mycetocola sp.]MCU1560105.1 hypothetical protein [Mycetocola sp.]HEV7847845.1 hypothetical protein [Mycetocola sp.]
MTDNEQTEHPKPRDRSHHDETANRPGQSADGIPDGSGTNTDTGDTAEDTASGGPAD